MDSTTAIGWVHNRNAWVMNSYYLTSSTQNFFGCTAPSDTSILLSGFLPGMEYHINWFPTWMNSTVAPVDTTWFSDASGNLLLDLSTSPFGDTITYYLDTLRSDYAFVITPEPFFKQMELDASPVDPIPPDLDFDLFPNPSRTEVFVRMTVDAPKDIVLFDPSGRHIETIGSVTSTQCRLPVGLLAKGVYYVRVSAGLSTKVKKLVIH